jgi:hypothetical protein
MKKKALALFVALLLTLANSLIIVEATGSLFPEQPGVFYISIQSPIDQEKITSEQFKLTFVLRVPPGGFIESIDQLAYDLDGYLWFSIDPKSYINAEVGNQYGYGGYHLDYSNYTYSVQVNAAGLPEGSRTVEVVVSGSVWYSKPSTPLTQDETTSGTRASIKILFDVGRILRVSVLSPLNNQTYMDSSLDLNFTLSIPSNWIGYSIDGQPPATIAGNTTLTGLSEGWHNVTVYATNVVGRKGNSESVYFKIGRNPTVLIQSLENITYFTGSVPLNLSVDEPVSQITYSLDGKENVTISGNTTLSGLANGNHTLIVYVKDEAGYTGTSGIIHFAVEVPFPTTLVIAASGASAVAIAVGLLVYFKKRKHQSISSSTVSNNN